MKHLFLCLMKIISLVYGINSLPIFNCVKIYNRIYGISVLTLCLFITSISFAQVASNDIRPSATAFPEILIPNTNSTHPFGVFMSRIQHHYQKNPLKHASFTLNIASGNVWLPKAIANLPTDQKDRDAVAAFSWHARDGYFDFSKTPNQSISFEADGVLRRYQLQYQLPIQSNQSLSISPRIVSFDSGKIPFSFITNDGFIEWVHSNIAGGEDPFARKSHGLTNQAYLLYSDRNDKTMQLRAGNTIFSGIDLAYYYYPKLALLTNNNMAVNLGLTTGVNTNKINSSIDMGASVFASKTFLINKKKQFQINANYGLLRQRVVRFSDGVEISNRDYMHSAEMLLAYTFALKKNNFLTLSTLIFTQTSYLNKQEYDYIVLTGNKETSLWHYSVSHLYRNASGVSIIASYTKGKVSYAVYLREDIPLNNAPDTQTGVAVQLFW